MVILAFESFGVNVSEVVQPWAQPIKPRNGRADTNVDAKLSRGSEDFRLSISGGAILSTTRGVSV